MGPKTGTDERYSVAVGELWSGLARTLTRLDLDGRRARTARRRRRRAVAAPPAVRAAPRERARLRPRAARRCRDRARGARRRAHLRARCDGRGRRGCLDLGRRGCRCPRSTSGAARFSAFGSPGCGSPHLRHGRVVRDDRSSASSLLAARRVRPGARRRARLRRPARRCSSGRSGWQGSWRFARSVRRLPALVGVPPSAPARRLPLRNDEPRPVPPGRAKSLRRLTPGFRVPPSVPAARPGGPSSGHSIRSRLRARSGSHGGASRATLSSRPSSSMLSKSPATPSSP